MFKSFRQKENDTSWRYESTQQNKDNGNGNCIRKYVTVLLLLKLCKRQQLFKQKLKRNLM